jgi:hypothetical protein
VQAVEKSSCAHTIALIGELQTTLAPFISLSEQSHIISDLESIGRALEAAVVGPVALSQSSSPLMSSQDALKLLFDQEKVRPCADAHILSNKKQW